MAVTREFVDFAVNDQKAKDLFDWMRDIRVPDEHFFNTLNHNPQFKIYGSYKGKFFGLKAGFCLTTCGIGSSHSSVICTPTRQVYIAYR
jgi:Core-2/I-Branching enzyme